MKRFTAIFAFLLAFSLFGCASQQAGSLPLSSVTPVEGIGHVGDAQIVPTGLLLQLVSVQQKGQQWWFHFRAQNNTQKTVPLIGHPNADFQFYAALGTKLFPAVSSNQHAYPSLPSSLRAQTAADGWIVSSPTAQPNQILYRYGTVHTKRICDLSPTQLYCPATLFRSLIWNLS